MREAMNHKFSVQQERKSLEGSLEGFLPVAEPFLNNYFEFKNFFSLMRFFLSNSNSDNKFDAF